MRPVDSFLDSVRHAFRPSDGAPAWVWGAILFFLGSVFAAAVITKVRRRRNEDAAFLRFLGTLKVSARQIQLLDRLARDGGVTRELVATRIDIFERVTAIELAKHAPPSATDGEEGIFGEVGSLRRALGFERIAGHLALLTTRELSSGQVVRVAGTEATVTEVTEAYFAVAAPARASFPIGAKGSQIRVALIHGQEARYETRCALLAREMGPQTQKFIFAHDEQPTRIQMRSAVRVTVRGPVALHPVEAPGGGERSETIAALPSDQQPGGHGALLDISVGGAAIDANIYVSVGSRVQLSFELEGFAYRDLVAFVLECQPRPRDLYHMRVRFQKLAQAEENQLAASVARFSAKPFAQQQ